MRPGCNMHHSVHGVKIRWETSVVLFWVQDELGETLDCVRRVVMEEAFKSRGYGRETYLDLCRQAPGRGVILLVCGLVGVRASLRRSFASSGLGGWRR